MKSNIKLGVIADDFTGASDIASFLANAGNRTVLSNGTPQENQIADCDCLVVALKSRSTDAEEAVMQVDEAIDCFERLGAKQIYFKYCSTFDSTPAGNIGPVCDHLLERYAEPFTILCPSLPIKGRTVKNGHIYVDGIPLDQTSMRNHPLNPMWDSSISELMCQQSKYPCFPVSVENMDSDVLSEEIQDLQRKYEHFYLVPDFETDEDGRKIADCFAGLRIMTGGSGLAAYLKYADCECGKSAEGSEEERTLILSGSCSDTTKKQIEWYVKAGLPYLSIDADALLDGTLSITEIRNTVRENQGPLLVYSRDEITEDSRKDGERLQRKSHAVEALHGYLGQCAVEFGYNRIIVAGGETSGAVTKALGYRLFKIGPSVDPGVPVLFPAENHRLRLVLKSGNFGSADFFLKAILV